MCATHAKPRICDQYFTCCEMSVTTVYQSKFTIAYQLCAYFQPWCCLFHTVRRPYFDYHSIPPLQLTQLAERHVNYFQLPKKTLKWQYFVVFNKHVA